MSTASETNLSLFQQLEDGAVQCGLTEDQSAKFIPQSLVHKIITKANITANLSWGQWLYSQLSPANSLVDKIHDRAKKVFAILILIGQEDKIRDLVHDDNITDDDLPLARGSSGSVIVSEKAKSGTPKEFTSFKSWDERRVRDFLEKQWMVLAPVLDVAGKSLKLHPSCPLPIEKGTLKVRATGVFVYQAWLHPAHQQWSDEAELASSVAIKEVKDESVFNREKANLRRTEELEHPNLVKLLASCEKGSFRCFIFPWADGGNLWDFWKHEDQSPRTTDFIMWLLEQVFGLIDAIRALHENNIRHGDIKPQNILHFTRLNGGSSERGTLVLADVGVSKFHEHVTGLRNAATDTLEVTLLYEAPEAEYDRRRGMPRSRRYDMWSSGCMLLEFIVWLLYGFGAVETFRSRRISSKDDPTTAPGNFFRHNSKGQIKIHSMVVKAMELLKKDPRCEEDTAVAELLELIEGKLLQVDPKKRAEAPELHKRLQEIVTKSRGDASYLWKGVSVPPETPKFFVRSTTRNRTSKTRKYSDSSEASSGSLASRSSGSSGSSSGWNPHSTGGSLNSMGSYGSRDGT